jgi:ABC-type Fe3+-hydroxamate transport system substrate-binding protein/adenosylcobinamide amidohydrolase
VNKKIKPCLKNLLIIFIITGCLYGSIVSAQGVVVKDSKGNLLTIKNQPQRLVSLVPSATEILFEINAKDSVIALTYHDATLEGALDKAVIGGVFLPSIEKINQAKPDMIIASSLHKKIIEQLKNKDCTIFLYDTASIEQSFENILVLGKIFDREDAAKKLIKKNKRQIDHIKKKLLRAVNDDKKRVIRLMGRDQIMTPGNTSFQNDLIRQAGGIPPDFGKKGGVVAVTKQEWMSFNPEVIYGCGRDRIAAQTFFSLPGWKDVAAVKNNQIFYFPCELTCRAASHSGYFVSWLASMVYMDEFTNQKNNILPIKITGSKPVKIELDYVKSAVINYSNIYDFTNKTLLIDFKRAQTIVSTLEGQRDNILTIGNHYSPPPTWGVGHKMGTNHMQSSILKAMGKNKETASFLMTGADMDNLSVIEKTFKNMKVTALVTAGVMSNAMRMSKDTGMFYEPGTINIIILTNMQLSKRAMTRTIISATEAKTAALEDLDIRSTYTPKMNAATGTGTDNILVVQGEGVSIEATGGHTKMGELIAKAVYEGVNQAILKQNKVTANRHIFQRLKERGISLFDLTSNVGCGCPDQEAIPKNEFAQLVDHVMLEPRYAGFLESALALSDEYEKGLIKDLTLFEQWCQSVAEDIAGNPVPGIRDLVPDNEMPYILKTALDSIFTGAVERLRYEKK